MIRSSFVIVIAALFLFSIRARGQGALNACDLNSDGSVNVVDVQWAVNMDLGVTACTANVDGAGVCNVVVVQRVINASLGQGCVTGSGSSSHSVSLTWSASTSSNVAGYNIYRGTMNNGPYPTKLNSTLVTTINYTDTTVQAGQIYYYVATAVDTSNNESAYSTQAQATVPSP